MELSKDEVMARTGRKWETIKRKKNTLADLDQLFEDEKNNG